MNRREAARQWYQTWKNKPATLAALKRLNDIGGTKKHIGITQERIALACFDAVHYKPELDPGQIYRDKIRAEKRKLAQLRKAAHVLALSAGHNEKALMWACAIAESTSGVRLTRKDHSEPMALNLVVKEYFSHLETALDGRLPEIHGGPFLNRFRIGNFLFEKAISAGKPLSPETMLAYELAFYLRMHTAGRASDVFQDGQPMPTDGDPCYTVVAAFCRAVFGGLLTEKQLQDDGIRIGAKVRDMKSVGLTDWPNGGEFDLK